jgi:hypothetical protein
MLHRFVLARAADRRLFAGFALALVFVASTSAQAQVDTVAAREARAALREMQSTYGRFPAWEPWLRQPAIEAIEYELQAGDRAEPSALIEVAEQLRKGSESFFKPAVFQRLATALEARAIELAPTPAADWPAACRTAAENYSPVEPDDLKRARPALAERLDALERRLPRLRTAGDEWREFLYWPETRWLATSDSVDATTLDRLEIRWCGAPTLWADTRLVEASLAVQSYIRLLRAHLTHESQETHRAAWTEFADLIAARGESSGGGAERIAQALTARERLGQSSPLIASMRRELSRPNIVLRARTGWLESRFVQSVTETFDVNDVFAGARSVGSGTLSAKTSCQILPSTTLGHWILRIEGASNSSTTGNADRVSVSSRATTKIRGEKPLSIGVRGVIAGPATASATTAITYDRIDAEGIRRRRDEAVRQTHARRGEAEAQASARAKDSVIERMNEQGARLASELSRPYRERLRNPQLDANRMPPEVRVRTNKDHLRWECRLEGPGKFAAASAPDDFSPEADVVVSFAASALEEQSVVALGGRQLTADELTKELGKMFGDPSDAAEGEQDFRVEFAAHPCDIEIEDGQLRARFHMSAFASADVEYPPMTVDAVYAVQEKDGGLALVQQGKLQVKPPALADGAAPAPSGRQQTLRLGAERKLNKALAKEFFWSGPPVPGSADKEAKMRVRGAQAERGWLQVALGQD